MAKATSFQEWLEQTDQELDCFVLAPQYESRYQAWQRDQQVDERRRQLRAAWRRETWRHYLGWLGIAAVGVLSGVLGFALGRWVKP